ncbi:MAG: hypothetical protein O9284_17440 [Steroidobacteraceae bacterium]|nr:hypothetical protein [Steroidobacteraceae bacterium]
MKRPSTAAATDRSGADTGGLGAMRQAHHRLTVATRGRGLTEIRQPVVAWVESTGLAAGLVTRATSGASA